MYSIWSPDWQEWLERYFETKEEAEERLRQWHSVYQDAVLVKEV